MGVLLSVIHINEAVCIISQEGVCMLSGLSFLHVASVMLLRCEVHDRVLIEVLNVHAGFSNDVREPEIFVQA